MGPATSAGRGSRTGLGQPRRRGDTRAAWLLLVHQLPANPSKARVKAWRRLQQLGSIAVRNSVYVLPDSPQAREDFEWMRAEIVANGGEASVFAADTVDSITRDEIVSAFREDRERQYRALQEEARELTATAGLRRAKGTDRRRIQRAVRRLRDRYEQVFTSDFFGAARRAEAERAVEALERLVAAPANGPCQNAGDEATLRTGDYRGRTWLTRPRPGIDRSGSAWLIRRFIDPSARFVFGDSGTVSPKAIPFDMYDVEFSHHGDRCTFEVLAERFAIADPAVEWLGRMVHDLDLKENRYHIPEAATVGRLIDGLRHAFPRDRELLEQGMAVFEALYRSHRESAAPPGTPRAVRRHPTTPRRKGR